jgi:branched-chain amino acid transport system ATP-binding protein
MEASRMEALRVEHLSKDFGGVHASRDISFKVESGERLAIIGPNGAGKTTLFNLLGGQLAPSAGRLFFFGQDITGLAEHKRAHMGIARSFQITTLFSNLSVLENVMLALQGTRPSRFQVFRSATSYKELFARAQELLNSVDLWEKRDEPVHSIAYGQQRKLEITLSLALEPKLLLLDEATTGLTTTESTDIINRIRTLGKNITLIFVAHDMDLVFCIAERIIVLHYGEMIAEGTCDQIKSNAKVNEIYMGIEESEGKCLI